MATVTSTPLLSYDYGNQIGRSRLEVSRTGVVKHTEVLHGQATNVRERKLTTAETKQGVVTKWAATKVVKFGNVLVKPVTD